LWKPLLILLQIINVTIANSNVLTNNAICNDAGNSTTTDLNNLLPAEFLLIVELGSILIVQVVTRKLFNAVGLPIGDYNFEYKVMTLLSIRV
jgi:NADH:ubiquinone oxidoreductase subunit 6 (subunit J)